MKYFYAIVQIIVFLAIQFIDPNLLGISKDTALVGTGTVADRVPKRSLGQSLSMIAGTTLVGLTDESVKPYGLHYYPDENSWTLYATVLQTKETSIYGRPGEIAQIEYSIDGESLHTGWIAIRLDEYFFVDGDEKSIDIYIGQEVQLYISGDYVSLNGVDWENCSKSDVYCTNANFVEGGFPKSEDYFGLSLCPSNAIIYSGSITDDWINGILAWRVKGSPFPGNSSLQLAD